jgi:AcrR family transcriptional regulator
MAISADHASAPKKQGRRPGSSDSRQVILDAARARFAKDGFTGATIRKIAADSGVDASLVMQFFGSKDDLFREVMAITPSALTRISDAFDGPEDAVGERVTRAFLQVWDGDPPQSESFIAVLRAAISNEQATTQLHDLIQSRVVHDLVSRNADMTVRVEIVSSMLIGVIVGRRIVHVAGIVELDREALVQLIAPAVQAVLVPVVTA